jgi:hypothetical protein
MRVCLIATMLLSLACGLVAGASAQEGFPLDGTWRGSWGSDASKLTTVVVVMKWDGTRINGTINPGRNSVPFESAVLDPSNWMLHIEANSADGAPIVIDAILEDIGSYNRRLEGTWTQGGVASAFEIARE